MMRASRNTTQKEKKNSPKFSSAFCDQNFSSAFALKKHRPFLSTLIYVKENERNGQDYQKYALFVPFYYVALFLSLFLSFVPALCFLCVRILSLSPFVRLCLGLCVCGCLERPDLRLGVLFPFQPQVFFSCTHVLTFPLFIILHLLIQFAASAPATSADRPWP